MTAGDAIDSHPIDACVWSFGSAEFDEPARELRIGGQPVALEPKPMALLAVLLRHAGEVVTKSDFFDAVWQDRITVDHVLATAIGKLRRVLDPVSGITISTVPRIGYRLDGTVRRTQATRHDLPKPGLAEGQAVPGRPGFVLARCLADSTGKQVWLARNDRTDENRVYKFALDGGRLRSLRREATLARVLQEGLGEREDIVPILDWQFQEPPFFLEYRHGGVNLREWFEHHPNPAELDQTRKLALFLKIVDSVAAAHGIGVLHKDIKPDNILVDDDANPAPAIRLIDFGSGVLLDPDTLERLGITRMGMTGTHDVAVDDHSGTLFYLAPEVLAGAMPTVRSDVYALGVLLYQWLIGDFHRSLLPGWERDIDDELLRRDIAGATDGVESVRMASAAELAERIRRLPERHRELRQQREQALREQQLTRSLERARARRPWLLAAIVLLAAGLGASLWSFEQAREARIRAEAQGERAQAALDFLRNDILAVANPEDAGFAGNPSIPDMLERAAVRLHGRFPGQPAIRAEVTETLARTYAGLGRYETGYELFQRAIDDYADAVPADHRAITRTLYEQVRILSLLSRYDEADALLARADRLRSGHAPDPRLDLDEAVARGGLAALRFDIDGMMRWFRQADGLQRRLLPDDATLAFLIRMRLVDGLMREGDLDGADALARDMQADALFAPERVGEVAGVILRNHVVRIMRRQYRPAEAAVEAEAVVADFERLLGPDHDRTISALSGLSILYNELDDCERTIATAEEVVARKLRVFDPENQSTLLEIGNLGMRQNDCGLQEEGLANVGHAERELRRLYGEDQAAAHYFRFYSGRSLSEAGRHGEALALLADVAPDRLQAASGVAGWRERFDAFHGMVMVQHGGERRDEGLDLLRHTRDYILGNGGDSDILESIDQFLAEHDPP